MICLSVKSHMPEAVKHQNIWKRKIRNCRNPSVPADSRCGFSLMEIFRFWVSILFIKDMMTAMMTMMMIQILNGDCDLIFALCMSSFNVSIIMLRKNTFPVNLLLPFRIRHFINTVPITKKLTVNSLLPCGDHHFHQHRPYRKRIMWTPAYLWKSPCFSFIDIFINITPIHLLNKNLYRFLMKFVH